MGPVNYGLGEAVGARDHPHRGFETVTYILEGELEHKDSQGNSGRLGPGSVQWMTAGSGVVHSEMPPEKLVREGGRSHGLQLWVNLPQRDKMIPPRYQEYQAQEFPQVQAPDKSTWIKIIAGSALGKSAIIETRTPIIYLHLKTEPNSSFLQAVPPNFNVFVYVLKGTGVFGPTESSVTGNEHNLVLFEKEEGEIRIENKKVDTVLEYLIIGGVPLEETVVQQGPFVMNTQEEIHQAWEDFYTGKLGTIDI